MLNEEIVTLNLPYPNRGDKKVRVYIPAHEEGETLPVVYMTDGQNLFDVEDQKNAAEIQERVQQDTLRVLDRETYTQSSGV